MSASVRGLLCVGLLVQLLVRARHRVDFAPEMGWESVLDRLEVLADHVADRAIIEALPRTDLRGMFQRMLNRWPAKGDLDAAPPQPLLALLTIAEAILGETRDEVMPKVPPGGDVASLVMTPPEPWPWGVQWGADRTLCCPPAANPERQIDPAAAPAEVPRG